MKILLLENVGELEAELDAITYLYLKTGQFDRFHCLGEASIMAFDWYNSRNSSSSPEKIIIYFTKGKLYFVCEGKQSFELVSQLTGEGESSERTLCSFFVALIKNDMDYLEQLEERITQTEDDLLTTQKKECAKKIISYRRELLRLKKYYEQLSTIMEGLTVNENDLITDENIRHFRILDSRTDRLYYTVNNLRDYVTQVREAYQASIDIEQNNLMKIFTVVSSVFMPLTLIVGWYGMNLQMPEYELTYMYPIIIGVCIVVCILCIMIFKKKKWF